jgi:hypothetical protein
MADNVTITSGANSTPPAGTVVATDDVGGAHYQVVKIALGLNSAVDTHLDSGQQLMSASVPVVVASDHSDIKITLDGESVAITGTVQVQSNAANLATQATVAAIQTAVELIDNAISGSEMQTDIVSITAGASVDIGAIADVEATGDGSIIAILKRVRTLLGGTLTVSGTVAATQSGAWNITNISGTVSLPTGASTAANQSTIIGHLDGVEGLLTTIDADTGALAGAVSGSEMQVDIVASLPAGTNNIGDVDVLSVIPGTGATDLGKAEDAGHSPGDVGVMALAVRQDANNSLAGTDLDYAPLQVDATGSLKVAIISGAGAGGTAIADDAAFTPGTTSITPVGGTYRSVRDTVDDNDAGAFAMTPSRAILAAIETPNGDSAMDDTNDALRVNVVAGSGSGVSHTDDAAFTPASDDVVPIAGFFDDDTPDSVNEGDAGAVRMSGNRNLYVQVRDAAGNERGLNVDASGNIGVTDAGGALTVDNGGTFAVQVSSIAAGDNNIGNVDIASIAAGDNNIGNVDIATMPNVTLAAGTNTNEVVGDAAHDAAAAGNPLLVGAYASASAPSDVSGDGDAVRLWADRAGRLQVGDGGGSLTVDVGTALPAGTNNIGDVDILSIAAGDNNIGNVDVVTMPGIVGTVADDATTPGNPVMIGGKAVETDGTDPTSVSAEDDVAIIRTDRNRRLLVNTAHPNQWVARENHTSAQTNNELKAAPGANLSLYITDIIMSTDTATNIKLVRDTAGTPADIAGPFYFAANGGISAHLVTPIRVTANQNVGFTGGATGNFTVEIHGYTAP